MGGGFRGNPNPADKLWYCLEKDQEKSSSLCFSHYCGILRETSKSFSTPSRFKSEASEDTLVISCLHGQRETGEGKVSLLLLLTMIITLIKQIFHTYLTFCTG